jgi:elongation factor G
VPRLCFANKMDRPGASYQQTIDSIRARLGANPIAIQMPIGAEDAFVGVIDLLENRALMWKDPTGDEFEVGEIPPDLRQEAAEMRGRMVEQIAETDEELTLRYLDGAQIGVDELRAALRRATIAGKATPVLCGSSLRNKGVQPMLDAVVDYLPSPVDIPDVHGTKPDSDAVVTRAARDDAPLSALVFKIVTDPYVGRLAYFRVYSGKITQGSMAYNSTKGKRERVGRLLRMYADHREDIAEVLAGDIAAVLGMKETFTGDTLCDSANPIVLEAIHFPEPVIFLAIEPRTAADQSKMGDALQKLSEEDPTFRVSTDENSGQLVISGMGELHLEVLVDRMRREFNVRANVGRPRVAYRESITANVPKSEYRYIKQTGGRGQYGHAVLTLEPGGVASGITFESRIVGGTIPREYIPAVEKGVREAAEGGVLAGYPVVDVKVTLIDGSFHEVDSSEMAFKMAGSLAFKQGVQMGRPVLLEPVMRVEVLTPDEFLGEVTGDLASRRGAISGIEMRPGNAQAVHADVPLAQMFGYATDLRSMTQGRGVFTMEFDHYAEVAEAVTKSILTGVPA